MQLRSRYTMLRLLAVLGFISVGSILLIFFWMTTRINQSEYVKARDLISISVQKNEELLALTVADYAHWDIGYDLVTNRDDAGVLDSLGTGATESVLFDQLFILGSDRSLLYAYDEYAGDQAHDLYVQDAFDGLWYALAQFAVDDHEVVSAVTMVDGQYFMAALSWIAPDETSSLPPNSFPVLLGVRLLDDDWLGEIANVAQVDMLTVSELDETIDPQSTALLDASGNPIAVLRWTPATPGTDLRNDLLSLVLIVCTAVLAICGSAAAFFQSQHTLLEHARDVASTDQLTRLSNRAGLDEYLSSKHIKRAIATGTLAVLFLDLNNFKRLNDEHGHTNGDIALKVTAKRLQSAAKETDFVARLGGDEFIVVLVDQHPEQAAVTLANLIVEQAAVPIPFTDHEQVITPAVGISIASPGISWETLLVQSDAAMYWSKRRNALKPVLFCGSMVGKEAAT